MSEQANKTNDNSLEDVSLERLPKGIVTMLLTGYTKNLEEFQQTNRKQTEDFAKTMRAFAYAAVAIVAICVGGFIWYLSQYDVNVYNYGNFENSKVNASNGNQADTINTSNYYGKEVGNGQSK